jgi:hypothetical protein
MLAAMQPHTDWILDFRLLILGFRVRLVMLPISNLE